MTDTVETKTCGLCHETFPTSEMTFVKTWEDVDACEYCYDAYRDECDSHREF
jgi:uncharacterized CHY-type Zn-finger protein